MCLDYWNPAEKHKAKREKTHSDDEHERNNLWFWINKMQLSVQNLLAALRSFRFWKRQTVERNSRRENEI